MGQCWDKLKILRYHMLKCILYYGTHNTILCAHGPLCENMSKEKHELSKGRWPKAHSGKITPFTVLPWRVMLCKRFGIAFSCFFRRGIGHM